MLFIYCIIVGNPRVEHFLLLLSVSIHIAAFAYTVVKWKKSRYLLLETRCLTGRGRRGDTSLHKVHIKSTTVYVPSSELAELGRSHPLYRYIASECAPPPGTKGGGGTRLGVRGWGSLNSDDWRNA